MSELVWPAVVLVLGVLAFIRTRPAPKHIDVHDLQLGLGEVRTWQEVARDRIEALENEIGAEMPKAVVQRINALSEDMMLVKNRVVDLESALRETSNGLASLKNQQATKR